MNGALQKPLNHVTKNECALFKWLNYLMLIMSQMFLQCITFQCLKGLMFNLYTQFMGASPSLQINGLEALFCTLSYIYIYIALKINALCVY